MLLILIILIIYLLYRYARKNKKIVIVWFYRPDCGYCTEMEDEWDNFTYNVPSNVYVKKININKNRAIANKFNVSGVPYIIKITNKKITEFKGERTSDNLLKFAC